MKRSGKLRDSTVDFGPYHLIADFAVNGISEINRVRSGGKAYNIALGSRDKTLVGKQIDFKSFHKIVVVCVLLNFKKFSDPSYIGVVLRFA